MRRNQAMAATPVAHALTKPAVKASRSLDLMYSPDVLNSDRNSRYAASSPKKHLGGCVRESASWVAGSGSERRVVRPTATRTLG